LRLALWSPAPRAGDWSHAVLPHLEREATVVRVTEPPVVAPSVDRHLYELANDAAHAFAGVAALARPGVLILRDFSLHDLVAHATLGRSDALAYLREMRRAHGETGSFVARQVLRGLGGTILPSLLTVNDRLLEGSLGVITATETMRREAARRLPGRLVLALPLDFLGPAAVAPSREEARRSLGLAASAAVVAVDAATPETGRRATVHEALTRLSRGGQRFDVVEAEGDPLVTAIAAADVVIALRFPAPGGIPEIVVRCLEIGRPVLVTAGTPPAEELPADVVVPVDPDQSETAQVEALVGRLLARPDLGAPLAEAGRAYVAAARRPEAAASRLAAFLREVAAHETDTLRSIAVDRRDESTLLGWAMEEVRWGARDVGLLGVSLGLEPLLGPLLGAVGSSGERA
jgi:hypothetical protein